VLLRTIYLSLDPYMRGRMSTAESYATPLEIGDVMLGGTVCEVVESRAASRTVGDLVLAFTGWQTHAVVDARHTRRLDPRAAPISTALGVLGMPGFTAYAGLLELGRPKAGETVVVGDGGQLRHGRQPPLLLLPPRAAWFGSSSARARCGKKQLGAVRTATTRRSGLGSRRISNSEVLFRRRTHCGSAAGQRRAPATRLYSTTQVGWLLHGREMVGGVVSGLVNLIAYCG
jgi:hypothetical protein